MGKPKDKPFKDQRSSAARDLRRAGQQTKHQLFRDMLQRALRAGFSAAYVPREQWEPLKPEGVKVGGGA